MNKLRKLLVTLAPTPVSSVDLFAGAILPGMLLVIIYTIWIFYAQF